MVTNAKISFFHPWISLLRSSQSSAVIVNWVLHSVFVPDEDSAGREV